MGRFGGKGVSMLFAYVAKLEELQRHAIEVLVLLAVDLECVLG